MANKVSVGHQFSGRSPRFSATVADLRDIFEHVAVLWVSSSPRMLYLAGVRLQTGRPARIVSQVSSQAGFELKGHSALAWSAPGFWDCWHP